MNQNIQDNLVKLLDAYLEDLKTEADTVTHIVNYINESSAARAALAEQLESYFWTREKKAAANGLARRAPVDGIEDNLRALVTDLEALDAEVGSHKGRVAF